MSEQRKAFELWALKIACLPLGLSGLDSPRYSARETNAGWDAWRTAHAAMPISEPVAWVGQTAYKLSNGEFPPLRVSRTRTEHFCLPLVPGAPA